MAVHGGAFPGSGRQAEPTTELTRLRRELARVTEERDILKKRPRTSRGSPREVRLHPDSGVASSGDPALYGLRSQS